MAMGSNGTVEVSPEMMANALEAISTYRTAATNGNATLSETVTGIVGSSFVGSAATAFQGFYTNKISKLFEENLTQMLDALQQMCEGIKAAIPDSEGVDEKLAEGNNQ
jgi:uncharacterized protein YukE